MTNLWFCGQAMSLHMLKYIWACAESKTTISNLRTHGLTPDHFDLKNSHSWMRVYLSVQVFSQTMIHLIITYRDECGGKEKHAPTVIIIEGIARLVDICNNTEMSNRGVYEGCEAINSPLHKHIKELLDILELFCEWRNESKDDKSIFLPWHTFDDLYYLVMGIVGISITYLKEDELNIFVQRRSGSDDVENEIAGIRERNPKPAALYIQKNIARRSGFRSSLFNSVNKANTRGDKYIYMLMKYLLTSKEN